MTSRASALVSRPVAWIVLLVAVLASAGVLSLRGTAPPETDPTAGLPASAESTEVAVLQERLPEGETLPALVVVSRADGGALAEADEAALRDLVPGFTDLATGGPVSPVILAPDRTAALVTVPLDAQAGGEATVEAVDTLRERLDGLPDGLKGEVTGGAGFETDLTRVFEGADATLLLTTVAVVAVLLLLTYRSPVLWLIPLLVIGIGDQVAASLLTILDRETGLGIDESTTGIVSILVFGAGTNYALLLIARYREELRRTEDRFTAMRRALGSAGPAIVASAATVALSLLTLVVADLTSNRALGITGALGIAVALLFGVVVLPAALVLAPRGVFWPFVPTVGSADPTLGGPWSRVARFVARRPAPVAAAALAVLAVLSLGLARLDVGLSQTENFRERVEAIEGLETLSRAFPAGSGNPLAIITTAADADAVVEAAAATPGVARATPGARSGAAPDDVVQVDAVLEAAAGTPDSDRTIEALRERLDAVGTDVLVGGETAIAYDTAVAAERDQRVVAPLVLAVVFVILLLLLRSLVAAVVLVSTVVLSFAAAFGAATLLFGTPVFDFPAVAVTVPLLAFLFLVALGVDYNIFLTTRAREEAVHRGTREGMTVALAVTGGVITSAGVLLAAVFTVLGVLPLILLTQIGVIVGIGVLLDTLLVRSVLVPAAVHLLGRSTWWPSALSRRDGAVVEPPADRPAGLPGASGAPETPGPHDPADAAGVRP